MTVAELIAILRAGNPKAEVVRFDHFGDPRPYDASYFGWRSVEKRGCMTAPGPAASRFFYIDGINIGPDPD